MTDRTGPGRPPLSPKRETVRITVTVEPRHIDTAKRLSAKHNISEGVRVALELADTAHNLDMMLKRRLRQEFEETRQRTYQEYKDLLAAGLTQEDAMNVALGLQLLKAD